MTSQLYLPCDLFYFFSSRFSPFLCCGDKILTTALTSPPSHSNFLSSGSVVVHQSIVWYFLRLDSHQSLRRDVGWEKSKPNQGAPAKNINVKKDHKVMSHCRRWWTLTRYGNKNFSFGLRWLFSINTSLGSEVKEPEWDAAWYAHYDGSRNSTVAIRGFRKVKAWRSLE